MNNDIELFKKYNNKLIRNHLSKDYMKDKNLKSLKYNINSLIVRSKELLGEKYAEKCR